MTDKKIIYAGGVSVFLPNAKAPSFVKYDVSVEPRKFVAFLKEHQAYISDKGYFRFTIKEGTDGSPYIALDTFIFDNKSAPTFAPATADKPF